MAFCPFPDSHKLPQDSTSRKWKESVQFLKYSSSYVKILAFPVAQMVKNLPAKRKTQIQSLDREDPLEKGMATHSRILTWRIPWTEEPGGLQPMDRGAWRATAHGVTKSQTRLSD